MLLVLGLASGCIRQQQQEQEPEVRWARLTQLEALIETSFELDSTRRKEKRIRSELRRHDWLFEEILKLDTKGYVYHPRLLEFAAGVGVLLDQGRATLETETEAGSRSESGSLFGVGPEYDIDAVLLGKRPASLSLGLNRSRTWVRPAFAERSVVDVTGQQAEVTLKHHERPARFYFSHTKSEEEAKGLGEDREDEAWATGFVLNYTGKRSNTELRYEYEDRHERVTNAVIETSPFGLGPRTRETAFETVRRTHEADFDHSQRFGTRDQHRLDSHVSFRDETGTFPWQRFAIDESLVLEHSETLSSHYALLYSNDKIQGTDRHVVSGSAGLTHKLYQSLVTDLEVHGQWEEEDGLDDTLYGVGLTLDYRKKIPRGTLYITLGGGYELADEEGARTIRVVTDERHVLSRGTTTLLAQSDVLIDTIVVTDEDRTRRFLAGADYRVVVRGVRVELSRVPSGSIPNESAVLVSYSYLGDTSLSYGTSTLRGRIQVDLFDHLSLYASHLASRDHLLSGADDSRLEDLNHTIFGGSVYWGPATLRAEYEDYDSSLAPYRSIQVSMELQHRFWTIHRVFADAIYRHVTFGAGGRSTLAGASASYEIAPRNWPSVLIEVGYQQVNDSGFNENVAYGNLEVNYHIRSTEISIEYEIDNRDDDFASELTHYLLVSITRRF